MMSLAKHGHERAGKQATPTNVYANKAKRFHPQRFAPFHVEPDLEDQKRL